MEQAKAERLAALIEQADALYNDKNYAEARNHTPNKDQTKSTGLSDSNS